MTDTTEAEKHDLLGLRRSVELEERADLYAVGRDLSNAVAHMREANRIRKSVFGNISDPNELREHTHAALKSTGEG